MPNHAQPLAGPGPFRGSRKECLLAQADLFVDAVVMQRQFSKRFPPSFPHREESTVNGSLQSTTTPPERRNVTSKCYLLVTMKWTKWGTNDQAVVRCNEARHPNRKDVSVSFPFLKCNSLSLILFTANSRLLKFQYVEANFAHGEEDPMAILKSKLTSVSVAKPRTKTGFNMRGPARNISMICWSAQPEDRQR